MSALSSADSLAQTSTTRSKVSATSAELPPGLEDCGDCDLACEEDYPVTYFTQDNARLACAS